MQNLTSFLEQLHTNYLHTNRLSIYENIIKSLNYYLLNNKIDYNNCEVVYKSKFDLHIEIDYKYINNELQQILKDIYRDVYENNSILYKIIFDNKKQKLELNFDFEIYFNN